MTELVICEIRIAKAVCADRGDSDSWMTSFEIIMPLKLQSNESTMVRWVDLAGNLGKWMKFRQRKKGRL